MRLERLAAGEFTENGFTKNEAIVFAAGSVLDGDGSVTAALSVAMPVVVVMVGTAVTVEFGPSPESAYLHGRATRGTLHASSGSR